MMLGLALPATASAATASCASDWNASDLLDGSYCATRNVPAVTFRLTLEPEVSASAIDTDIIMARLATLYGVPLATMSLSVLEGGSQLVASIRPPDSSDASVSALRAAVRSTSPDRLQASLEVNATVHTVGTTTVEEEYAAICPVGFWCIARSRVPCPRSTYNNRTGAFDQGACTSCPPNAITTSEGSTGQWACICKEGRYARRSGSESDSVLDCVECPVGADCSVHGATPSGLSLQVGYWRASNATLDVRRCSGSLAGSGCIGTLGAPCKAGLRGPYCALCNEMGDGDPSGSSVYYHRRERECRPCEVVSSVPLLFAMGGALLACCVAHLARWIVKRRREGVAPETDSKPTSWKRHALSIWRRLLVKVKVKVKVKVLVSFYQVATTVETTFLVALPRSIAQPLGIFSFVNLELDGLGLPLACMGLGSFEARLLATMLAPVGILLLALPVSWVLRDRAPERVWREEKTNEGGKRRRSWLSIALHATTCNFLPVALRVVFLAFPAVSSLAFKAFRCDDLDADDGRQIGVMSEDFAVSCWAEGGDGADGGDFTPEYQRIRYVSMLAIFLFPICVPCAHFLLLWKVRRAVWSRTPSTLSASIAFLTGEYHRRLFFWDLVEMLKKLLLVGVVSVAMPGTLNQLIFAFVIVLVLQTALLASKPHRRAEDHIISLASGFFLVMFFFFTLVHKVQTLTEELGDSLSGRLAKTFAVDDEAVEALLLASALGALVVGGAMAVIELTAGAAAAAVDARKQGRMAREKLELREREKASAEEVDAMRRVLSVSRMSMSDQMKQRMIDAAELKYHDEGLLGAGAFGEVWQATLNDMPVAVKKLHRDKLDEGNLRAFRAEFELQLSLRHPNIVKVIGGSWNMEDVNVCAVLELCDKGTLQDILELEPTRSMLSWAKHKLPIAADIARAMAYLHGQSPPIIHRDLTPQKVLIDDTWHAKLLDLGCSQEAKEASDQSRAGTPLFMAPELLRTAQQYDEKVDVWSFGCVIECMWTHAMVYEELILEDDPIRRVAAEELRPSVPGFLSLLVQACCEFEPEYRCTFAQIIIELANESIAAEATHVPPGPARTRPPPAATPQRLPAAPPQVVARHHLRPIVAAVQQSLSAYRHATRPAEPASASSPDATTSSDPVGAALDGFLANVPGGMCTHRYVEAPGPAAAPSSGTSAIAAGGISTRRPAAVAQAVETAEAAAAARRYDVGTRVCHPSRGPGKVVELMEDGRTRVAFESGEEHRYKPESMYKLTPGDGTSGGGSKPPAQLRRKLSDFHGWNAGAEASISRPGRETNRGSTAERCSALRDVRDELRKSRRQLVKEQSQMATGWSFAKKLHARADVRGQAAAEPTPTEVEL